MHIRARDIRNTSAFSGELGCGDLLLCRRDSDRRTDLWIFVHLRGGRMVFEQLRSNDRAQIVLGLLTGIVFGFLLQKAG